MSCRCGPRKIVIPCPGEITNPFKTVLYDARDKPIYTNIWGYHLGIDIGVSAGTPVLSAAAGAVVWADWDDQLGYCAVVEHVDKSRTLYAHLFELDVYDGKRVRSGQRIGLSGETGELAEGAHLHFEVWVNSTGRGINPYELTRDDPTALPADPAILYEGLWPQEEDGQHTPGYTG